MNEIRNELLLLLDVGKAKDENDRDFKIEWLLDKFESDIRRQLEDIRYKEKELEGNLKTLDYVRNELLKKEDK